MTIDLAGILPTVIATATAAGDLIVSVSRRAAFDVRAKAGAEIVTSADLESDGFIRASLSERFPDYPFLSEEVPAEELHFAGPLWLIDPIDGTANYAHHHPYVSIAIALAIDGIPCLGVVHAPFLGETFAAYRGGGAVAVVLAAAAVGGQAAHQFEVASIKVVEPYDLERVLAGQQARSATTQTAERLQMTGVWLGTLVTAAFKARPNEISGPSWLVVDPVAQLSSGERRFDVNAGLPAGATAEHLPGMLQALLVERFKLAFHREQRESEVYALVVGPSGHKLTAAPPAPATVRPTVSVRGGVIRIAQQGMAMTRLAAMLTAVVGRQVVDQTALSGGYAVSIELAASDLAGFAPAAAAGVSTQELRSGGVAEVGGSGSAFRSLADLGLKLEPRRIVTNQIVIDRLEALPTSD